MVLGPVPSQKEGKRARVAKRMCQATIAVQQAATICVATWDLGRIGRSRLIRRPLALINNVRDLLNRVQQVLIGIVPILDSIEQKLLEFLELVVGKHNPKVLKEGSNRLELTGLGVKS